VADLNDNMLMPSSDAMNMQMPRRSHE
jgi:hypothetical protein